MGCDLPPYIPLVRDTGFQFTHPCGVRHCLSFLPACYRLFQFTHPCGVRPRPPQKSRLHGCCVSIHAPVWGATDLRPGKFTPKTEFQFTHPCGVRLQLDPPLVIDTGFNSRTRVGCDQARFCGCTPRRCFNSRTRVGCDVFILKAVYLRLGSFNSRTRVGCDGAAIVGRMVEVVSIHAPVWGATSHPGFNDFGLTVSIHAPVWGATGMDVALSALSKCFNSRTRVGCDRNIITQCF